jgi:predicted nucleotidyltransferase
MPQERAKEIKEIISSFKEALEKNGVKAEKIILFGSHAKGAAGENSDIDLVVISRDFAGMSFKRRCEVLGRAITEVMEPIEPLAYTPEEFKNLPGFNAFSMAKNANSYVVV